MTMLWRALFVAAALNVGISAGAALAQSADVPKPADAQPSPEAKAPADAKKADEGAKPIEAKERDDASKPAETKKAADAKKPAATGKQSNEIYQSAPGFLAKKFAVAGYDTVAYHKEMKPVAGKDEFKHTWKGAVWRFASKENLDAFVADPEKYAPQYGGYCAYAVAHNGLSPGNPRHWKIVDGKLYLNLDGSVQTKWERQQAAFIKRGDSNWPNVLKKK